MKKLILLSIILFIGCEEDTVAPDTSAPTVVITFPVGGSTLTETTTVTVDVADDGDIGIVKLLVDGVETYADTTAPYQFQWDVCVQAGGDLRLHTLMAKTEDGAGNQGQSDLLTFTVDATYDCASVCGGDSLEDNCEVCDADASNDCAMDCADVWGGDSVLDDCGVCNNYEEQPAFPYGTCDCAGTPNGTATTDNCGTCDSDSTNDCPADCNGDYGGTAVLDDCNDCVGGNTEFEPNYAKDDCGVCDGDNSPNTGTCDCASTPNGDAVEDMCGTCDDDASNDCVQDECGEWGGDGVMLWGNCYSIATTTTINFNNMGLTGETPSNISALVNLTYLDLGNNNLTTIPDSIGNLTNLEHLSFFKNELTTIPESIGNLTSLINLDLGSNDLTSIPTSICNIYNNETVLDENNLCEEFHYDCITRWVSQDQSNCDCAGITGGDALEDNCGTCDADESNDCVQDECGEWGGSGGVWLWGVCYNIGAKTKLDLSNSGLTGEIPPEIGSLTNLTTLLLYNNQLTGSIPSEIGNLINLTELKLKGNQLTGIPPEIGNLTNLTHLYLENNQFTEIPPEIGNLTSLNHLNLIYNQLSGEIPPEIGNLTSLTNLLLHGNQLTGIPPEIGNLTNLTHLYLQGNQLSGEIPPEIGHMTNLTTLHLYSNQLSGEIPPEIGNLTNLTELWLQSNQLTGEIPPEIGNLTNLTKLLLDNNQLTGEIPLEIGNLTSLTSLSLLSNQLTALPESICNLPDNCEIDVRFNQLCEEYHYYCISIWETQTTTTDCAGTCNGTMVDANNDGICDELQGTVTDIDGNTYKTIKIGDQNWMAENLKVIKYRDETSIPHISDGTEWFNLTSGAYSEYNNVSIPDKPYGLVYNWYAANDSRGACMEGWHVPTKEEWETLVDYLGGDGAGGKLKECTQNNCPDSEYWSSPNSGATNESGFTALPFGDRQGNPSNFSHFGNQANFWTNSENSNSPGRVWYITLNHNESNARIVDTQKDFGIYIRCIKSAP